MGRPRSFDDDVVIDRGGRVLTHGYARPAFDGALFDWKFGEQSMPARYSTIDGNRGGLWDTPATSAES